MKNQNEQLDDQQQKEQNLDQDQSGAGESGQSNLIPDQEIEGSDADTDSVLDSEETDEMDEDGEDQELDDEQSSDGSAL